MRCWSYLELFSVRLYTLKREFQRIQDHIMFSNLLNQDFSTFLYWGWFLRVRILVWAPDLVVMFKENAGLEIKMLKASIIQNANGITTNKQELVAVSSNIKFDATGY